MNKAEKGVEPLTFKMDESTGIGTIEVLAFENAAAVDAVFARAFEAHPKGLILDLRSCTGFDLAALRAACWLLQAPLDAGAFVDARHRTEAIDDRIARVVLSSSPAVDAAHAQLKTSGAVRLEVVPEARAYKGPLAVLTLDRTRSSGEVLAALLKARTATRFFGAKTAGRPRLTFERALPQGYVVRIPEYDWRRPGGDVGVCDVKPDEKCTIDQSPIRAAQWLITQFDAAASAATPRE